MFALPRIFHANGRARRPQSNRRPRPLREVLLGVEVQTRVFRDEEWKSSRLGDRNGNLAPAFDPATLACSQEQPIPGMRQPNFQMAMGSVRCS
jgi:hypothetical protein